MNKKDSISYIKKLKDEGYENISNYNGLIRATKDNNEYTFEIHTTDKKKKYFGGTTITSWTKSLEDEYYYYVIIWNNGTSYTLKPSEFIEYCDIPPFKVTFNIYADGKSARSINSLHATEENIKEMIKYYNDMKNH